MPKSPKRRRKKTSHVRKNTKRARSKRAKNKRHNPQTKRQGSRKVTRNDKRGRKGASKNPKLVSKKKTRLTVQPVRQGKSGRRKTVPAIETSRTRGKEKIHLDFKHVRSIDKKIALLDKADSAFKKQFKRKSGEPPMGMVVTVTDRHGRSASDIAPSEMVVNRKNTKEFIARFLKSMKSNNNRFRERNQNRPAGKTLEKGTGYDDFNPDNVVTVTVKFIYAKEE